MVHRDRLLKAATVGFILGAVPYTLLGLMAEWPFGATRDLRHDLVTLSVCSAGGMLAALAVMVAYTRAIDRE